jgi:hypothetical protein
MASTARRPDPTYSHPTPLKNFKRDEVLIFESKGKAAVVLTPPSGRMQPVLLFAFQALASLVI